MRAVVTGAAGFIGSHVTDALLAAGSSVVGVDCFTEHYDRAQKMSHLAGATTSPRFELVEADLRTAPLDDLIRSADVVFHLAAQPGVRDSWEDNFSVYLEHNVLVTQRLLEAARRVGLGRFVYASSSSVYGNALRYPTRETDLPKPFSPYGVTKLAAEHLCALYGANYGLPTVSLRYFTVYGPRQRPEMAMHRLVERGLSGEAFPLFGTGENVRDFTYVEDVVAATVAAGSADVAPGSVFNVSGGSSASMLEVIHLVGELLGAPVRLDVQPGQPGDVERTGGATDAAAQQLDWVPRHSLEEGLSRQVAWHRTAGPSALREPASRSA